MRNSQQASPSKPPGKAVKDSGNDQAFRRLQAIVGQPLDRKTGRALGLFLCQAWHGEATEEQRSQGGPGTKTHRSQFSDRRLDPAFSFEIKAVSFILPQNVIVKPIRKKIGRGKRQADLVCMVAFLQVEHLPR